MTQTVGHGEWRWEITVLKRRLGKAALGRWYSRKTRRMRE